MRGRVLLLAVLLSSALFAPITSGQPPGLPTMRAHFIEVGQGAATLIEFPCAAVLIDTGGEENGQFKSTEALIDYLDTFFAGRADLNKTLASLILTHPHIDHTNGVADVLAKFTVQNAVTNGQEKGSGRYGQRALHKKVDTDHIGFTPVHVNDMPPGKGLTNPVIDPVTCQDVDPGITALWGTVGDKPTTWNNDDFENQNNHSVAIRIDFGSASLLVPGDLETRAIGSLLARLPGDKHSRR
jgi:competence protein ComEC